jgi:hypothetical protein
MAYDTLGLDFQMDRFKGGRSNRQTQHMATVVKLRAVVVRPLRVFESQLALGLNPVAFLITPVIVGLSQTNQEAFL